MGSNTSSANSGGGNGGNGSTGQAKFDETAFCYFHGNMDATDMLSGPIFDFMKGGGGGAAATAATMCLQWDKGGAYSQGFIDSLEGKIDYQQYLQNQEYQQQQYNDISPQHHEYMTPQQIQEQYAHQLEKEGAERAWDFQNYS